MRKTVPILLIIGLIILAIIAPWKDIKSFIAKALRITSSGQSSISITLKVGEAKVFLNDKEVGTTPYDENNLKPGTYKIKLVKITDENNFYTDFERTIDVEEGTQVVINWEIGPSEEFSNGEIYFFKKRLTTTNLNSTVSIINDPNGAFVYFDEDLVEGNPIIINNIEEGSHSIKIVKDNYIEKDLEVICKSGYDLFIETRLFPIPIDIE